MLNMRKILYILIFLLTLSFVMGCSRSVDKRLVLADTLMWTAPDSSLKILTAINRDSLQGKENLAYHALLLTQAQFRCYGNCESDTLINLALSHYSDNHIREHYTRSLMYKGAFNEVHDNPVKSMTIQSRLSNGTSAPKTTPTLPTTATSRKSTCAWGCSTMIISLTTNFVFQSLINLYIITSALET